MQWLQSSWKLRTNSHAEALYYCNMSVVGSGGADSGRISANETVCRNSGTKVDSREKGLFSMVDSPPLSPFDPYSAKKCVSHPVQLIPNHLVLTVIYLLDIVKAKRPEIFYKVRRRVVWSRKAFVDFKA